MPELTDAIADSSAGSARSRVRVAKEGRLPKRPTAVGKLPHLIDKVPDRVAALAEQTELCERSVARAAG